MAWRQQHVADHGKGITSGLTDCRSKISPAACRWYATHRNSATAIAAIGSEKGAPDNSCPAPAPARGTQHESLLPCSDDAAQQA